MGVGWFVLRVVVVKVHFGYPHYFRVVVAGVNNLVCFNWVGFVVIRMLFVVITITK
jgi:hypothetical protein